MAGKCKEMSKIKQVHRLHKESGMSNRKIADHLDIYKGTVNKYVNAAEADSLGVDALLTMEEPELESRLCEGSPAYSDNRFRELSERLDYILTELQRKHVTMYQLWEEYRNQVEYGYGYTQFCYHINQHKVAAKPGMILSENREGGKELFVDFAGDTLSYIDLDTGEEIKNQVFVASLPASDYGFAMAVDPQKIEDFLYALEHCLRALGGVPKIIVTDNLKSSVIKSDRYQPELNKIMEDFANHYGCVVIPARAGKPKDKALVEDQVKLIYRRVYAPLRNRQFFSQEELNQAISEKMLQHNQKRMQQHPYSREEHFLAVDKPNLRPIPSEPFEIKYMTELHVQRNSYIELRRDHHYYSVPYRYILKKVKVIYTKSIVSIYDGKNKIAIHTRICRPGYSTIQNHLPSYFNDYQNLSPQKYQERAAKVSDSLTEIIHEMFETHPELPPETFYKSCDGLLHLQKTTDHDIFEKACKTALEYHQYKYSFIFNLIKSKCVGIIDSDDNQYETIPSHSNIRGREYYK